MSRIKLFLLCLEGMGVGWGVEETLASSYIHHSIFHARFCFGCVEFSMVTTAEKFTCNENDADCLNSIFTIMCTIMTLKIIPRRSLRSLSGFVEHLKFFHLLLAAFLDLCTSCQVVCVCTSCD